MLRIILFALLSTSAHGVTCVTPKAEVLPKAVQPLLVIAQHLKVVSK